MVWYGMVLSCMYGMYGMVWYGMAWYGMVLYGMYGMVWYGLVWYRMYVCLYVCMSVCMHVCTQHFSALKDSSAILTGTFS